MKIMNRDIELYIEHLFANKIYKEDVIMDPFTGSGTTGVACINKNLNFVGTELDETYYNLSKDRLGINNKEYKNNLEDFIEFE